MVYYRKYRPQKIQELDLLSVREKLNSILASKNIPHAFLFTGSRGLGKTSSARILAKAINCNLRDGIEPCNTCDTCIAITNGSHIDIVEIDGASNRGVDEIRSLREKVKFSPSELIKKVYIIDEVHMLTNEAFNALLKTLEEPPSHVVFVLATTEVHKIPQTILSRAFSVKFESPTDLEIINSLKRISDGERLKVDTEALQSVAKLSEGSFRDAAKILEELMLNTDGVITVEVIDKLYKTGSVEKMSKNLLSLLNKKDLEGALSTIDNIVVNGVDFQKIIEEMVGILRSDFLSNKSQFAILESKKLLTLLNEAYQNVKIAVVPQLPLELVVIEWCMSDPISVSRDEKTKKGSDGAKKISEKKPSQTEVKNPSEQFLKDLIELVHAESRQVAAFLRSCKDSSVDGSTLILRTPYSLHADRLSKKEFADLILKHAQTLDKRIADLKVVAD